MIQSVILLDPQRKISANPDSNTLVVAPVGESRISLKEIRELRTWVSQTAFAAGEKRAVILQADRLGLEAEQALLKTLEEPADQTTIILTVNHLANLLPTTVSRCAHYTLEQLDTSILDQWHLTISQSSTAQGLLFADFLNQPEAECWLAVQSLTAKGGIVGQLQQWFDEIMAAPVEPVTAAKRVRQLFLLDEALQACRSHVQPKLVIDRFLVKLADGPDHLE